MFSRLTRSGVNVSYSSKDHDSWTFMDNEHSLGSCNMRHIITTAREILASQWWGLWKPYPHLVSSGRSAPVGPHAGGRPRKSGNLAPVERTCVAHSYSSGTPLQRPEREDCRENMTGGQPFRIAVGEGSGRRISLGTSTVNDDLSTFLEDNLNVRKIPKSGCQYRLFGYLRLFLVSYSSRYPSNRYFGSSTWMPKIF